MQELTAVLASIGDTDALGVVLAATGPVFSAGHNFGDMAGASYDEALRRARNDRDWQVRQAAEDLTL